MQQLHFKKMVGILCFTTTMMTHAAPLSWGDADTDLGKLTISGWARASYVNKSWTNNDGNLAFQALKLAVDYDSKHYFGQIEARCYQWSKFCDFTTLVNANVGYKITPKSSITVGMMDTPFGPSRAWSSAWYSDMSALAGLSDSHKVGVKYQQTLPSRTQVNVGFFPVTGGSYKGTGVEGTARFSSDVISYNGLNLKEKNVAVVKVDQALPNLGVDGLALSAGASYWYSQIDNITEHKTGSHQAWALFTRAKYQTLNLTAIAGQNKIDNKSSVNPDFTYYGSFDSVYAIANDASFLTLDARYTFKNVMNHEINITPYMTYSRYDKAKSGWADSVRTSIGSQLDYHHFSLATEYVESQNDLFLNGGSTALASAQKTGHNHLVNVKVFYNF